MKNHPVEEKFPLLLLYVEENGKKSDFPQRVVFANKGRAQVTSCWFTSITIAFTFILLTFIIFMTTLNPLINSIHPRCTRDLKNYHGNNVIHVVKHGIQWNSKQLEILKFIADTFPKFQINNIIVDASKKNFIKQQIKNVTTMAPLTTSTKNTSVSSSIFRKNGLLFPEITSIFFRKFNEIIAKDREMFNKENSVRNYRTRKDILLIPDLKPMENITFDIPNITFLNISLPFLKRVKRIQTHENTTYSGLLNTHKNIKEKMVTYKEYFTHTPLAYYWPDLNTDMIIFAVRVQELWQNGGISFFLPKNDDDDGDNKMTTKKNDLDLAALKSVIVNTKYKYEILPKESVNMDGQGLHMATRTPCHTFFGELLMRMQKDTDKLTVSNFITNMLNIYCRRGAIDSDYCKKTQIK